MTSRQKQQLKQLLARKKDELDRRCGARRFRKEAFSGRAVGDFADSAFRDNTLEFMCALDEHDFKELQELDAASLRLVAKDFGRCRECGKPIQVLRLLSVPETGLCYACAVSHEHNPAA